MLKPRLVRTLGALIIGLMPTFFPARAATTDVSASAPHHAEPTAGGAALAAARKAIGTPCRFTTATYGPQVAGFTNIKGVGQLTAGDLTAVIRQAGLNRFVFLATTGEKHCKIVAAEALPTHLAGEDFLDCRVDDPDPDKIPPLSQGIGLRTPRSKPLAAYVELDIAHKTLIARDGDDKRIKCNGFESGD